IEAHLPLLLQGSVITHLNQCHLVRLLDVRRQKGRPARHIVVRVQSQHILIPRVGLFDITHIDVDVTQVLWFVAHCLLPPLEMVCLWGVPYHTSPAHAREEGLPTLHHCTTEGSRRKL